MSTFSAKIADLIGSVSDTDAVSDALTTGFKLLIDMMPEHIFEEHSENVAVGASNGLAMGDFRIHKAFKGNYGARRVDSNLKGLVQNAGSIYYAVSTDPVWLVYNRRIYIYPNGGNLLKLDYPTVLYSDSDVSAIKAHLHQIPITYAAIQLLTHQIHTIYGGIVTDISSLTSFSPAAPTEPAAPAFSYTPLDNVLTISASALTFSKPIFRGDFSTLDTPLDTEEDVELASAHIGRLREYLTKYRADLEAEVGEFNKEVETYRQTINYSIEAAKQELERDIVNQNTELREQVEEYKAKLEKYATDIQAYVAQVNAYVADVRAELELNNANALKSKIKMETLAFLQGQYKHLIETHLGVKA